MIACERCGKQIPDTAVVCPVCGTTSPIARSASTDYGSPSISYEYLQGYGQQSVYPPPAPLPPPPNYPSQPGYGQQSNYVSQPGYGQQPNYAPQPGYGQQAQAYPSSIVNVSVSTSGSAGAGRSSSGAVVVEVLLSVFLGVYGVGWLMAGETTPGIILLICSLLLYWPTVIVSTIFTLGIGLVCVVPVGIGLLILNAVLLNNAIKRKTQVVVVQTAIMQQQPPLYPRQ